MFVFLYLRIKSFFSCCNTYLGCLLLSFVILCLLNRNMSLDLRHCLFFLISSVFLSSFCFSSHSVVDSYAFNACCFLYFPIDFHTNMPSMPKNIATFAIKTESIRKKKWITRYTRRKRNSCSFTRGEPLAWYATLRQELLRRSIWTICRNMCQR